MAKTKAKKTKAKKTKARASKAASRKTVRKAAKKVARKPAKKSPAKKSPAKKSAAKKSPAKTVRTEARPSASNAMRELAQRIVDMTIANDDPGILALYADDVVSTEMGQPPSEGIDAIRAKFEGWRAMASDAVFEPRRVLVDGNTIVVEWLGRVTLAATGRQTEMHEVAIHEIRDGKIVREAYFYNPAALS